MQKASGQLQQILQSDCTSVHTTYLHCVALSKMRCLPTAADLLRDDQLVIISTHPQSIGDKKKTSDS